MFSTPVVSWGNRYLRGDDAYFTRVFSEFFDVLAAGFEIAGRAAGGGDTMKADR